MSRWLGRRPGERYLLPSERRVVSVRLHPAVLTRTVLELLAALIAVGWLTARIEDRLILDDLLWYAFLAVLARATWKVLEWSNDRFVVSDRRVLLVSGLLTRRVAMMPLRKVTDMTYERPMLGRLLGYGEFVMESAGQDQALHRIRFLPSPDRLYLDVSELIFGAGGQPGDDEDTGGSALPGPPRDDLVEHDDAPASVALTQPARPWWLDERRDPDGGAP